MSTFINVFFFKIHLRTIKRTPACAKAKPDVGFSCWHMHGKSLLLMRLATSFVGILITVFVLHTYFITSGGSINKSF